MPVLPRRLAISWLAVLAACAPTLTTTPTPPTPGTGGGQVPVAVRPDATYLLPPAIAFERNLMPLIPTGVPYFLQAHPTWDGRGVLIAILDSGIDPQVEGLKTTTNGQPKLLDLRDFSGEGRIALSRVTPSGDQVTVQGRTLRGAGRLRGVNANGPWYGGVLREIPLGDAPASDVNWNNVVGDTLPVLVTKAMDGWILLADLDGDGSLANERPVHDYLVARESFGWAATGRTPSLAFAANFAEAAGEPVLDLYFDNSGHGTHVAGIAAGNDIYGVPGFDGVAPGAELLGLKISNNAQGGISTSGSMLAALKYALRTAEQRQRQLVINMSFGVGNELEGSARVEHVIDSILALHPNVVFTISAGNDGPGLSTLGFPGSAERIISVGATFPRAFLMREPGTGTDPIAFFSSRGGEVARPDIITPGVAFSTVPKWKRGDEPSAGTSMASPHAAGLAALLVSALSQEGKPVNAARIRQALVTTAQPLDGLTAIDQGGGVPNVGRAWRWLAGDFRWNELRASTGAIEDRARRTAFIPTGVSPRDTSVTWQLQWADSLRLPTTVSYRSDAGWIRVPLSGNFTRRSTTVSTTLVGTLLQVPGTYVGTVTVWGSDTLAGPVARLVHTVVVPAGTGRDLQMEVAPLGAGLERRLTFGTDVGRPFQIRVASAATRDVIRAYLHEPGGQPFRGGHEHEGSTGEDAALFRVDARDVVGGNYEVIAAAPPIASSTAGIQVTHAPFAIHADLRDGKAILGFRNLTAAALSIQIGAKVIGAAQEITMDGAGADTGRLSLDLPAWVRRVEVDVQMPPSDWPKFTDFGVTLEDATGAQLEASPMNYAFGRLETDLPRRWAGGKVELRLYPAWAELIAGRRWTVTTRVRLYADTSAAQSLTAEEPGELNIPGRGIDGVRYTIPAVALAMPSGTVPLIRWSAKAGSGEPWTLEAPFAPAPTPLMR
jgi:tripeptidyl-peptidase-2